MSRRGSFVVVEGIDGSGKDTQAQHLAAGLRERGRRVLVTGSPSKWYRSQPVAASFIQTGKTNVSMNTLAALGAADRMMCIDQEIRPALDAGVDVICVRYIYSTFGYFLKRGADIGYVEAVNALALSPTHGLLLVLTPETAVRRVRQRDDGLTFEERDPSYLDDVQREMVRRWPDTFLKMDAGLPEQEIAVAMLEYVLAAE